MARGLYPIDISELDLTSQCLRFCLTAMQLVSERRIEIRKFLITAICACLLAVTEPCIRFADAQDQSARTKAREVMQTSLSRFVHDNDIAKAREGMQEALRLDPTYMRPKYNLGLLASLEEKWDEAIRWYSEYRQGDPGSETATRAQLEVERIQKVRELDRTPDGRKKRLYDDAINKVHALIDAGLPREAVREAARASKLDDSRWEAYAVSAAALASEKLYVEAQVFLTSALERAPQTSRPGIERAQHQCQLEIE